MKHPLHKKMPLRLDLQIRLRLLRARFQKRQKPIAFLGGLLLAPAVAMLLFFIQPSSEPTLLDTNGLITAIRTAQVSEIEKSATSIYHVKRIIVEGADKPEFVALTTGENVPAESRTDVVETWQHNDTALALVESNQTARSFEAFLSIEHNGVLALHHYGPENRDLTSGRKLYDQAHDLSSLYQAYSSLSRPDVPTLPETATFTAVDTQTNTARFTHRPEPGIEVQYDVDIESKLVVTEIIYVLDSSEQRYEMTRISYLERSTFPPEAFAEIFDPLQFAYQPA